jgi:hypothetical protein
MKSTVALATLALTSTAVILGQLSADADSMRAPRSLGDGGVAGGPDPCQDSVGPDVIVGDVTGISVYGTVGGMSAYSIGTTSCNVGTVNLPWIAGTNQHPVIAQNIFRLKGGRFEQIGQSWLKHGFTALTGNLCACTCNGVGGSQLGVGCSDPYSSGLNGNQNNLGPRSHVNATTGFFPYPFENPIPPYQDPPAPPATVGRRCQVSIDDLNPALNSGALYFGEGQYISSADAAAGNDDNNASYRRITVGALSGGAYGLTFTSTTQRTKPAIQAWQDHGLGVNLPDPGVFLTNVDVPNDGRFIVGYKVSDNGDGTWHYEYAIQNLNSHQSGASFSVPVPAGVNISNIGFHDVHSHSGEPFSNADWDADHSLCTVSWATQPFTVNQNANALRWGTLYNFRFDADTPPTVSDASLGLHRPGTVDSVAVTLRAPSAPACPSDLDLDGDVDGADLGQFLLNFGNTEDVNDTDLDCSGTTDGEDLGQLLKAWGACP